MKGAWACLPVSWACMGLPTCVSVPLLLVVACWRSGGGLPICRLMGGGSKMDQEK